MPKAHESSNFSNTSGILGTQLTQELESIEVHIYLSIYLLADDDYCLPSLGYFNGL